VVRQVEVQLSAQAPFWRTVQATQALQLSCEALGLPVAVQPLNPSAWHISGKVMISGVCNMEPEESINTTARAGV
jgi:hypothetical protein